MSSTLHVMEISSSDVEAGLQTLLEKVKEVYGGEGRVAVKKGLLRKDGRYSIKYIGPSKAVELLSKVLESVKQLQTKGKNWTFTQRLEIKSCQ